MVIRQYFTISEGSLCIYCSFAPLMVSKMEDKECFVKKNVYCRYLYNTELLGLLLTFLLCEMAFL